MDHQLSMGSCEDESLSLFTDLYELTMAQAYWQSGVTAEACFSLFVRRLPTDRGYLLFAGLEDILHALNGLRFSEGEIAGLRSLGLFDDGFLEYLRAQCVSLAAREQCRRQPSSSPTSRCWR